MTAADAIHTLIRPLFPGWRIQLGRWTDGADTDRFIVIRPVGGMPASLVRRPQFSVSVIGAKGEGRNPAQQVADQIVELLRNESGELVHMQSGEPVYFTTTDGRDIFELAVSTITV